ncbi:major facilitator superfamily domain-containing protein [Fennellomyces sp. T-0311]|nr:major facilitator superfamily domain-containing protein [Fennellomyces sp. T-0311]
MNKPAQEVFEPSMESIDVEHINDESQAQDDAPSSTDPGNPQNWSGSKKCFSVVVIFLNAFVGYFPTSIYMPAVDDLMSYFNTSLTVMNGTIGGFILATAVGPLFWAPLSERIGRKPVYTISMVIFTVATVICGITNSLALFFTMRIIQGVSGSAGMTVNGGSVADMFPPHQRGRVMGILSLGAFVGPAVAPIMGGNVAKYLGWRWIFYICAMIGSVILLLNIFVMRETLYRCEIMEKKVRSLRERVADLKFNPFKGFLLLLRPEVLLITIPISVTFGSFLWFVTGLSPTYAELYHFDKSSLSLLYITSGLGNCSGSIIGGIVVDKFYVYLRSRTVDGVVKPEKRLAPIVIGIPILVAGSLMSGWFFQARLHWVTPLIGVFLFSFGMMITTAISTTYLVESYLHIAASVMATVGFVRNLVAGIFITAEAPARANLGDGWLYTLSALMCLFFYAACVPPVVLYGEYMRSSK